MSKPPSVVDRLGVVAGVLIRTLVFWVLPVLFVLLATIVPILLGLSGWWVFLTMSGALIIWWVIIGLAPMGYPISAFGPTERVDDRAFRDELSVCAACGEPTRQGLQRRYAKQWVAFSLPLHTIDWGENSYCLDCVDIDTMEIVGPEDEQLDERESNGHKPDEREREMAK